MTTYTVLYSTSDASTRSASDVEYQLGLPRQHRSLTAATKAARKAVRANAMTARVIDGHGSLVLRVAEDGTYGAP